MTWNEVVDKFLAMVNKIKELKPAYRQPGDGSDGTCDCIGLIIGAIRRMGLKWTGIHGSNWAARKELVQLKKVTKLEDFSLGDAVLKAYEPGESGWNLPSRYRQGGKYYNGDLKDYYHIGVITEVSPSKVVITHMTSPTVKVFTAKSVKDLGRWVYYGRLKILQSASSIVKPADPSPTVPSTGKMAVVVSDNGYPVKMRQYPSTSCATWEKLPVGTTVEIDSPGEVWAKINGGRRKGWYMQAKFLDIIGDGKGKY